MTQVVAGVLSDAAGRVLIARRPAGKHLAGYWEFPGGKLEPGEAPEAALARELAEELGIVVLATRPLIVVRHADAERTVQLAVYRVTEYRGQPHGREGQPLDWVAPAALDPARLPPADRPVITALRLPNRYLIAPEPDAALTDLTDWSRQLDRALARWPTEPPAVQLRAHWLDAAAYRALAAEARRRCQAHGALLLLNRDPSEIADLAADGLHLTSHRLARLNTRPALPTSRLIGASCHSAAELDRAARLGLDYALLSPVAPTASHPGQPPLGWAGFARLVAAANLPVYALGGLGPEDLERAIAQGGQGVAAMRGFWLQNHPTHGI